MNRIPLRPYTGASGKVTSFACRPPNGSQISDGMKVKSGRGSSTTISWRAPTFFFSSKAAVNPAKLDPMITTRLRSELDMSLSLPSAAMRSSDCNRAVGGLPCEGVSTGHHLHNCTFVYRKIPPSPAVVNSTPVELYESG